MFASYLGVDDTIFKTVVNTVVTVVNTVNLIVDANNAFFAPLSPKVFNGRSTRLPKRPRTTVI
jgi:hypothetical protein